MHTRIRNFEIPVRHFSAVKHIVNIGITQQQIGNIALGILLEEKRWPKIPNLQKATATTHLINRFLNRHVHFNAQQYQQYQPMLTTMASLMASIL